MIEQNEIQFNYPNNDDDDNDWLSITIEFSIESNQKNKTEIKHLPFLRKKQLFRAPLPMQTPDDYGCRYRYVVL